jgi:hypothetical protein
MLFKQSYFDVRKANNGSSRLMAPKPPDLLGHQWMWQGCLCGTTRVCHWRSVRQQNLARLDLRPIGNRIGHLEITVIGEFGSATLRSKISAIAINQMIEFPSLS